MQPNLIALDHVEPPYRDALQAEASRRGFGAVNLPRELAAASVPGLVALAVLQVDGLGRGGLDRVRAVRKMFESSPSVVMGRHLDPESVFEMSRSGVAGVVKLPRDEVEVVRHCFSRAHSQSDELPELVGRSSPMARLRKDVHEIARTRCNVLITGETGTGKGLVARAIHDLCGESNRLVHVDCASLSPSLIESELFGHERGAFTGAVGSRAGRFEAAGTGVVFLDEIGELDIPLQSKFLRVLEDREFERVGGSRTLRMRARVIAATSRDLEADTIKGTFRADLYYRLKVVHLHIPPLRERITDVPFLVDAGLRKLAGRLEAQVPELTSDAVERLMQHTWPGNVRELMNLLEALMVRHHGREIDARCVEELISRGSGIPQRVAASPSADVPSLDLPRPADDEDECAQLLELLRSTGGNVARVARRMNMARSTVRYKIRRHGLTEYIPRD